MAFTHDRSILLVLISFTAINICVTIGSVVQILVSIEKNNGRYAWVVAMSNILLWFVDIFLWIFFRHQRVKAKRKWAANRRVNQRQRAQREELEMRLGREMQTVF